MEGDMSSRALKPMEKLREKIKPVKSAWTYYMSHHFTVEGNTRDNCASAWKALKPNEKSKFEKLAAKDRVRFDQESQERDELSRKEAEEKRLQNSATGPLDVRERPKYKEINYEKEAEKKKSRDDRTIFLNALELKISNASNSFTIDSVTDEKDRHALNKRSEQRERNRLRDVSRSQIEKQALVAKDKRNKRLKFLLSQSEIFKHFIKEGDSINLNADLADSPTKTSSR